MYQIHVIVDYTRAHIPQHKNKQTRKILKYETKLLCACVCVSEKLLYILHFGRWAHLKQNRGTKWNIFFKIIKMTNYVDEEGPNGRWKLSGQNGCFFFMWEYNLLSTAWLFILRGEGGSIFLPHTRFFFFNSGKFPLDFVFLFFFVAEESKVRLDIIVFFKILPWWAHIEITNVHVFFLTFSQWMISTF